jgi:hypothetical protein
MLCIDPCTQEIKEIFEEWIKEMSLVAIEFIWHIGLTDREKLGLSFFLCEGIVKHKCDSATHIQISFD